jgi:ribose transport system permease protein
LQEAEVPQNDVMTSGAVANAAPPAAPAPASPARRRQIPETAALVVVLIVLGIFFSIKSPFFLNYDNFVNILTAAAVTGIIAAPATMLLIAGQFDLSVGSTAAFCGAILGSLAASHDMAFALPVAILAGLGVGALNGFLVTVVGINALITTLGTLAVFRGLTQVLTDGQTLSVNHFGGLGTARPLFDIPLPVFIFAGIALAFWFLSRYTVFGRSMYAIGANPVAARLNGLRSNRVIFIGFVLSGLCVAIGGLILASQLGAASPQTGTGLELSVVTAVILGGASLAGGRGAITGTMLGLLIIGTLNNGLILLSVSSFWQQVAQGTLLILAVSFDQLRIRLTGN